MSCPYCGAIANAIAFVCPCCGADVDIDDEVKE